jgi:hypothetical protein
VFGQRLHGDPPRALFCDNLLLRPADDKAVTARHPAAMLTRRLMLAGLALAPSAAFAAPKAELWQRWTAHQAGSMQRVDHAAWGRLLAARLIVGADGINRFAYGAVTAPERQALDGYVAVLAATPVSRLDRPEQRAFWINLYNALTVQVVLSRYPVKSIRDIAISPGLFSSGPWGKKLATVEGEAVSLDDIEHRILRPIWRDPRIHYAVNCASIGCPNLMREAYTAANTETLLEAGARAYVNHPRGARIAEGKLRVSSIYVWFQQDFGGDEAGVVAHLRRYAEPGAAQALAGINSIAGHDYDWTLNDAHNRV